MQKTKSRLVLILHPIGREGSSSFLDQSQSVMVQTNAIPSYLLKDTQLIIILALLLTLISRMF